MEGAVCSMQISTNKVAKELAFKSFDAHILCIGLPQELQTYKSSQCLEAVYILFQLFHILSETLGTILSYIVVNVD